MTPKYPNVKVKIDLNGPGGNGYAIMSKIAAALAEAGVPKFSREGLPRRIDARRLSAPA